jgi:rare lipoprotein A
MRRTGRGAIAAVALALTALVAGCMTPPPPPPPPPIAQKPPAFVQVGLASWYGRGFNRKRTADGERFNMNALTAAHRSLPLNSVVKVTNLDNGRSVVVRINDRGPYAADRIIDLSAKAARELGMTHDGLARVKLELVNQGEASL